MLAGLRKRLGLTQEGMARMVGVSHSHWVQIEAGTRNPSLQVAFGILKLAKAAGFSNILWKTFSRSGSPHFPREAKVLTERARPERKPGHQPERPERVPCPLCGDTMWRNREFDYYKCSLCHAEAWPEQGDDADDEEEQIRSVLEATATRRRAAC